MTFGKYIIITLAAFFITGSIAVAQQIEFNLWSDTINDMEELSSYHVYDRFGCGGKNVSPDLSWNGAPTGTKSFAISMFDPDAGAKGWWHWMIVNIPVDVSTIREDAGNPKNKRLPPTATQIKNDFGFSGYSGACPNKDGDAHHYLFNIYALDVEYIAVQEGMSATTVKSLLDKHIVEQKTLTTIYKR